MNSTPDWTLYATFLAVLRGGSLSSAARALSLTQPTAGRHIAALEQALGTALFTRSPQGLLATAAALDLAPHAEAMEAAAEAMLRAASGGLAEARGVVRLTASEVIAGAVLPDILTDFHEAHPGVVIELVPSDRNADLLRRDADIAVRMSRPSQVGLAARKLGEVELGFFAHRRYVERHGLPDSWSALTARSIIGFDRDDSAARAVDPTGGLARREHFALRCDSDLAQLAALRAGFGIGVCQRPLAASFPDLVPVLPDLTLFRLPMWLVMHEDQRAVRRLRLLYDHLAQALMAYAAQGRG